MDLKYDNSFYKYLFCNKLVLYLICISSTVFSQELNTETNNVQPPVVTAYKNDTSYANFNKLRFEVAKAQIVSLKKNGALLVRLKTNANTINALKKAGNTDLATQVERETFLKNKIIMNSYLQEFIFCPVYFFYSDCSDSVKHKNITGIFLDSNLVTSANIVCSASFYLIAESGSVYNSSLGIVSESIAEQSKERGTASREAEIVIKNRYFIQLHKPFPYFQIQNSHESNISLHPKGTDFHLIELYNQLLKAKVSNAEYRKAKTLRGCVYLLNKHFTEYYQENASYVIPENIKQYVY